MNAFDKCVMNLALETKILINKFFYDEEGDVNIVSMVVLVAIAVILAAMFRTQISGIMEKLFGTISSNVDKAVGD